MAPYEPGNTIEDVIGNVLGYFLGAPGGQGAIDMSVTPTEIAKPGSAPWLIRVAQGEKPTAGWTPERTEGKLTFWRRLDEQRSEYVEIQLAGTANISTFDAGAAGGGDLVRTRDAWQAFFQNVPGYMGDGKVLDPTSIHNSRLFFAGVATYYGQKWDEMAATLEHLDQNRDNFRGSASETFVQRVNNAMAKVEGARERAQAWDSHFDKAYQGARTFQDQVLRELAELGARYEGALLNPINFVIKLLNSARVESTAASAAGQDLNAGHNVTSGGVVGTGTPQGQTVASHTVLITIPELGAAAGPYDVFAPGSWIALDAAIRAKWAAEVMARFPDTLVAADQLVTDFTNASYALRGQPVPADPSVVSPSPGPNANHDPKIPPTGSENTFENEGNGDPGGIPGADDFATTFEAGPDGQNAPDFGPGPGALALGGNGNLGEGNGDPGSGSSGPGGAQASELFAGNVTNSLFRVDPGTTEGGSGGEFTNGVTNALFRVDADTAGGPSEEFNDGVTNSLVTGDPAATDRTSGGSGGGAGGFESGSTLGLTGGAGFGPSVLMSSSLLGVGGDGGDGSGSRSAGLPGLGFGLGSVGAGRMESLRQSGELAQFLLTSEMRDVLRAAGIPADGAVTLDELSTEQLLVLQDAGLLDDLMVGDANQMIADDNWIMEGDDLGGLTLAELLKQQDDGALDGILLTDEMRDALAAAGLDGGNASSLGDLGDDQLRVLRDAGLLDGVGVGTENQRVDDGGAMFSGSSLDLGPLTGEQFELPEGLGDLGPEQLRTLQDAGLLDDISLRPEQLAELRQDGLIGSDLTTLDSLGDLNTLQLRDLQQAGLLNDIGLTPSQQAALGGGGGLGNQNRLTPGTFGLDLPSSQFPTAVDGRGISGGSDFGIPSGTDSSIGNVSKSLATDLGSGTGFAVKAFSPGGNLSGVEHVGTLNVPSALTGGAGAAAGGTIGSAGAPGMGAPMMPMMPMSGMPGGRGGGNRNRKLRQRDPDDVWGADPECAPAVVGRTDVDSGPDLDPLTLPDGEPDTGFLNTPGRARRSETSH